MFHFLLQKIASLIEEDALYSYLDSHLNIYDKKVNVTWYTTKKSNFMNFNFIFYTGLHPTFQTLAR